ncbi:hypothetical protein BDZ45DRAFT_670270 [Acephala macrosclerotiorum]|nr:hypothetical protein BDZ45DRAFT_670270 [Acephala macrosclerotiorum]
MPRLARRAVWHTVRSAGRVRRGWSSSGQKHPPYIQDSFPNRERSLDPSTCHHIGNRIRSRTTNSPELPSSHQKPKPELPINSVKLGGQDKGLQPLSLAEEAIFYSWLSKIWEGLIISRKFARWEDRISSVSTGVWLSRIAEHIPTNVKLILVSPEPPTLARLKSLSWPDTIDGGVSASCFKPKGKQVSARKTGYLFIDSVCGYSGSLRANRGHWLFSIASPSYGLQDKALISKITRLDLTPDGEFVTLFVVPFKNGSKDEVMNDLVLVKLARIVLMTWLGAADEEWEPEIKDLVPWGLENIEYHGLARSNPLHKFKGRDGTKSGNHKGTE